MKVAGTAIKNVWDAWEDFARRCASETQNEARMLITLQSVSDSLAAQRLGRLTGRAPYAFVEPVSQIIAESFLIAESSQ